MSRMGPSWGGGPGAAWAIARRDLMEFVRDRRTLFITLLLPLVTYPVLALSTALGLRSAAIQIESEQAPAEITVLVSGRDAERFAERIQGVAQKTVGEKRRGWPSTLIVRVASPENARREVDAGAADLWVEAHPGIVEEVDGVGKVRLPVFWSATRPLPLRVRDQFTAVMQTVAADARERRMAAAGLPATVLEPLELRFGDAQAGAAAPPARPIGPVIAGAVLVMLAVLTLTGAFYPAIDAIAGEKERGTIETLLIAPCATGDLVLGKFLAVFAVTLATLVVNVVSIIGTAAVAGRFLPAGLSMAMQGGVVFPSLVAVLGFVGLAALAAATCLAVTTAAKSGKEAQNTLTPVILLVSALAGTALLPGMRAAGPLAAVPFAGQVVVGRAAFDAGQAGSGSMLPLVGPLAVTLVSSVVLTGLMLAATALMLTDEDILFRGPDVAAHGFGRPGRRERPTVMEGIVPLVAGLAALWYAQGFTPDDLTIAIPMQQLATVIAPLALVVWWQRVNLVSTFSLRWPGVPRPGKTVPRLASFCGCLVGAGLVGAGVFVLGATALLAAKGTSLSAGAEDLNRRLLDLMLGRPLWLAWVLMAVVPAVCEELLFRGWVLSAFAGKAGSGRRLMVAIVAQAVCFAVFHLLPERMPQTFAMGLVLGGLTAATRSLLPAMACHFVHNSMPLVIVALAGDRRAVAAAVEGGARLGGWEGVPAWAVAAGAAAVVAGAGLLAVGRGSRSAAWRS